MAVGVKNEKRKKKKGGVGFGLYRVVMWGGGDRWVFFLLLNKNKKFVTNDPSAGSPTDTLLRLLLPLNNKIQTSLTKHTAKLVAQSDGVYNLRSFHHIIQSVGATGGVYKGQGRSQGVLMKRPY